MIEIVNIKLDNPSVDIALYNLDVAIHNCKAMGKKGLIIIHGFGSHGVGGEIKKYVELRLNLLKRRKVIETFVKGEEWSDFSQDKLLMCKVCPQFILNSQLANLNNGVTAILIKK